MDFTKQGMKLSQYDGLLPIIAPYFINDLINCDACFCNNGWLEITTTYRNTKF